MLGGRSDVWLPVSSKADVAAKGEGEVQFERLVAQADQSGRLKRGFNSGFLTSSDATDASEAGVWGALKGSFLTIIVTMALAFPIGVVAVYLEELPAGTAGPTRSRFRSTISPPCRHHFRPCLASRCS